MSPVGRKVIVLLASSETNAGMRAWAQARGFDLARDYDGNPRPADRFDFHVTLVASANEVFVPETQHVIRPIGIDPEGFDVLGVDRKVPVLKMVPSARLAAMRAFFVDVYGIEPTFAEYRPHVSLSYSWDGLPDLEGLELPDMPLVFDQLRVKTLSPPAAKSIDWSAFGMALGGLMRSA